MSDMIRRNKAVPVQARRVEPGPRTVQIPGAGPIPVPPQTPGVTQNIIYVNVPAGQPQPAPPPQQAAEPSEIHLHTHVHQYPKRRRGGRYGTSFLGTLGLVLGGIACGITYAPQIMWLAKPIALAGAGCAGLGLLGAQMFRRNGRGMPMVGLLVCGIAYGLWMIKTGQAQLPKIIQDNLPLQNAQPPANSTSNSAPVPAPAVTPSISPPPTSRPPDRNGLHDHSIFGDGGHWGNDPGAPPAVTPPAATPAPATPATVTPSPAPPAMDVATATANLENARITAAKKTGLDYSAARTAASDAKAEYEQVRQTAAPGSPELMTASQQRMDADAKVIQLQQQLRSDPAVTAAEQVLKTAKAAGK